MKNLKYIQSFNRKAFFKSPFWTFFCRFCRWNWKKSVITILTIGQASPYIKTYTCWPAILAKKRKYYQQNCSLVNRFKTIILSLYVGFIFVTAHCYIIRTPSGTREKESDFHKDWTQKKIESVTSPFWLHPLPPHVTFCLLFHRLSSPSWTCKVFFQWPHLHDIIWYLHDMWYVLLY